MDKNENIKKRKLFIWSLIAAIFVACMGLFSFVFIHKYYETRKVDPKYSILSLVQTGPKKEALATRYFCELLELSFDKPTNLYSLDLKWAKEKLLTSPVIEKVELKKIFPNTLFIDYTTRTPIAWLYDFENVLIDKKGHLFPAHPFFSTKNLPQIYLGLNLEMENMNEEPLNSMEIKLAFSLLNCLKQLKENYNFQIKRIDVSQALAPSYGKRQIVLMLEHEKLIDHPKQKLFCIFPHILRLGVNDFSKQLGNYSVLLNKMMKDYEKQLFSKRYLKSPLKFSQRIIDLRMEKVAFIDQAE